MRTKKLLLFLVGVTGLILISCSKTCECTKYSKQGEPIGEVIEKQMPKSLKLDCSFFETHLDTSYRYKCK